MNEDIDLTKILKDCPKGTKFYSTIYGEVEISVCDNNAEYPIALFSYISPNNKVVPICVLTKEGKYNKQFDGECILFPSKEQRDWSKFTASWYKKERFDPKTLKPFDKVLVSDNDNNIWGCSMFSHIFEDEFLYACFETRWKRCIPYNDETKHLVGTKNEAPEFYRYWED